MLRCCLEGCGVAPSSYLGHSFRRGAATWAAANGADADTIRALGRWRSDCFRRYVDKSVAERAATSRAALYSNTSADLRLDIPAWPSARDRSTLRYTTRIQCGHGWELASDSPRSLGNLTFLMFRSLFPRVVRVPGSQTLMRRNDNVQLS
ncbi:uncharacterized protein UDID_18103 [Ustilago sp. UG-2017a]|nr:uncharacterized protein UDID_18103 [Ustilago sp. UG-2017a]